MSRDAGDLRRRRRLIVAAAILQLALFAALLAWRTGEWNRRGWAGLSFLGAFELARDPPLAKLLADVEGAVLMVAPGSPAERAGIAPGDVVVSVDGVDAGDFRGLWRLAGRKRLGDRLAFELRTGAGRERLDVLLASPLYRPETVLAMASSFLVGTAFLAVSLWVYLAKPRSRSAFVFFLMGCLGAAVFFVESASELDLPDLRGIVPLGAQPQTWAVLAVYALLGLGLTNLLLHLSLIFPRPRPIAVRRPAVFAWLHTVPFLPFAAVPVAVGAVTVAGTTAGAWAVAVTAAAAAAAMLWRLLRGRRNGLKETLLARPFTSQLLLLAAVAAAAPAVRLLSGPALAAGVLVAYFGLLAFFAVVLTAYSILTCGAFLRSYRESDEPGKRQLRWPLWGTAAALLGVTLLALLGLAATVSQGRPDPGILPWARACSRLLYLLIPISFACGILRYRLTP